MRASLQLSVYLKLAIPVVFIAAFFVALLHVYWGPQFIESQRVFLVEREEDVVRNIVPSLQLDLLANDLGAVHETLRRLELANEDESMQVTLLNPEGHRLYPIFAREPVPEEGWILVEREITSDRRVLARIAISVNVSRDLAEIDTQITTLERFVTVSAGVVLLMAVALNYWLVGAPLTMLARVAERLGKGDFAAEVPSRARGNMDVLVSAFVVMRDALRDAQQALEARAREAGENLVRYQTVLESMPGALMVVDERGRIEDFNAAAEGIFGYSKQEMLAQSCVRLFVDEHCATELAEAFSQDHFAAIDSEKTGVRKDGSTVPLRIYRKAMWADGKLKMVVIAMDIERIKEVEQRLLAAKDEAERASQAKTEFLSRMSHELRTPLNAILGFGQLLAMDGDIPPEVRREYVTEIIGAGDHLLELINEVLDLSRIEVGKLGVSVEPIDLDACIARAIAQIRPLAEARGVAVEATDPGAQRWVRADRTRLTQVLLNLLSNATKYNRTGGTIRLSVGPGGASGSLRVSVEDTGVGIDAKHFERLFQPFERIDPDGHGIEGSGIGLALSKKLVEAMQGTIGVTSRKGEGSTFWFELPMTTSASMFPAEEGLL